MTNITPEMIGYVAGILTTTSFLPQAIMTLKTRDTESLSLGMYSIFTSGTVFLRAAFFCGLFTAFIWMMLPLYMQMQLH